jgi:hypothetical protein
MMKQILKKQPTVWQGVTLKTLTTPEISIPPSSNYDNGKSKGFWRLK